MSTEHQTIDVVFDGPPGKESGRFVEVENADGQSISVGEWIERPDGNWALRLTAVVAPKSTPTLTSDAVPSEPGRRLVNERTAKRKINGVTFGYSLYVVTEEDGNEHYEAVLHNRTHEGTLVTSKWDSSPIVVDASHETDAIFKASDLLIAHMDALEGKS